MITVRTPVLLIALAAGQLSSNALARGPEPPAAEPPAAGEPATAPEGAPAPAGAEAIVPSGSTPPAEPTKPESDDPGAGSAVGEPPGAPTAAGPTGATAPPPAPPPAAAGHRFQPPAPPQAMGAPPAPLGPGPDAEEPSEPAPLMLGHWFGAELGLRTTLIADEGFEPYGGSDVNMLGQFVIAATFAPLELGPVSLAIVPEYSVGVRGEHTRDQEASISVHRLAGGVLADVALIRHLHLYARVALGATYLHGRITSSTVDLQLEADNWTWGLDTTGGLAVLLGAVGDRDEPDAGFWLRAELGYAFAGEAEMSYSVDSDDEARRFGSVGLPAVTPGGVISRWTLGVSFL